MFNWLSFQLKKRAVISNKPTQDADRSKPDVQADLKDGNIVCMPLLRQNYVHVSNRVLRVRLDVTTQDL